MNNRRAADLYKRTQLETVDQRTLIIMCYSEAIRSLQLGKDCYLERKFAEKAKHFSKASDIISELLSSLNMEAGGVIARNLNSIYNFLLRHILKGDMKRDVKAIEDAMEILSELKSAWEEIETKPVVNEGLINRPSVSEEARVMPGVSINVGI